jgi:DnaK suppressor protein
MALTEDELREMRGHLEKRRAELGSEIRGDAERVREREERDETLSGASPDPGDESVATLLTDLEHAGADRDLAEFRGVDAALARVDDDTYGVCSECGGPIDIARLRANPIAERCIECQRRHEKTHAVSSRSSL